jgi:hypothetical protein
VGLVIEIEAVADEFFDFDFGRAVAEIAAVRRATSITPAIPST